MRASPLGAGSIRLDGLDYDQTEAAMTAISALGGRTACRLTKHVKALVVSDDYQRDADDLRPRAMALGVPVLTLTEFLERARNGWDQASAA